MKTFLCSLFLIMLSFNVFAQDPQSQDDIYFYINNNSNNQNYTVTFTKVGGTNCYDANFSITTNYNIFSNTGINYISFVGCWKPFGGIPFGMGYYTVAIFREGTLTKEFYLDLRSATVENSWNDLNFNYYCNDYSLYINDNSVPSGSIQTFWGINPTQGYSPIIRQIATFGSPHIVWDEISNSAIGNYSLIGYIIYRGGSPANPTVACTTAANIHEYYDYDYTVGGLRNPTCYYWVSALYSDLPVYQNPSTNYKEYPKSNYVYVHVIPQKIKGSSKQPDNYFLTNYPNPFNPTTKIFFTLAETTSLEITFYNAYGQEVQQLFRGLNEKGTHELQFDGKNLSSGVYYYTLKTNKFTQT